MQDGADKKMKGVRAGYGYECKGNGQDAYRGVWVND
jgi:hypothetical protein